jgi:adenine phosphoribosyltransferase
MKMISDKEREEKIKLINDKVTKYPDFPKKGVLFYDLFSILNDPTLRTNTLLLAFSDISKALKGKFNTIAGIESRGLMLGLYLAQEFNVNFVAIRKPSKLPGKVVKAEFTKEYGKDSMELQENAVNKGSTVLVIDDLLATGGTLKAAEEVINKCGGTVIAHYVIFNIKFLEGEKKLSHPVVYSMEI